MQARRGSLMKIINASGLYQCKLTYLGLTHLWFLHCRASSLLLSRASSACLLGLPAAHAVFVYCGRKIYLISYVGTVESPDSQTLYADNSQ